LYGIWRRRSLQTAVKQAYKSAEQVVLLCKRENEPIFATFFARYR